MTQKTVKVRIARSNPQIGESAHYQTYEVPWSPRMTVMDALDYVYEHLDPTIAYHGHTSCHRRACTRCNVAINGRAGLMCHTEVNSDLTIEPLPRFRVIRDLVVEGL